MHPTSRSRRLSLAAAVSVTALLLPAAAAQAEPPIEKGKHSKTDKTEKGKKAQTKQVQKDIAGKDKRLARLATSKAVSRLDDEHEAALAENIDADRTVLADLAEDLATKDATFADTKQTRKELRSFRVQNYRLVVNILRKAEKLDDSADEAELAEIEDAVAAALDISATSAKGDVKDARKLLPSDDESETETETETD